MNCVDPILFQCRFNPAAAAICVPGARLERISYGRLERAINNASRMVQTAGLKKGDVAAVFMQDKILHAAVILGFARMGVVTLQGQTFEFPESLGVTAVVVEDARPTFVIGKKMIVVEREAILDGDGQPPTDLEAYRSGDDDPCRIVMTSGTTGTPKGVAISHSLLARRMARHSYMMGNLMPDCRRIYSDFSFNASLGMQFLFYVLSRGGTLFLNGPDISLTVQAFGLYEVEALVGSPMALAGFTKLYESTPGLQSGFKVALAGGSQLAPALAARASMRLCNNIVAAYGATEASMIASAPAPLLAQVPEAVGYVLPDVAVDTVDEAGAALPAGEEGRIRIRSPYRAAGYVGSDSAPRFQGEYFLPGDVGRVNAEGMLIISGREQALINVGGDKINPERVEAVLMAFPGVEQAGVLASTNEFGLPHLVAGVVSANPVDAAALIAFCRSRLPPAFVPARIERVAHLPTNEMGKLDRTRLGGMRELSTS